MAYAAVLSLNQTLEHISNPHPGPEQYKTPLQDQQIKSLQEKLNSLLEFMDHSWQRRSEEVRCLEREIREAAYKVEDMIDLHISKNFGQEGFQERQLRDQTFRENFEIVADEIDSINTKAAKLKELWGATDLLQSQRTSLPAGPSRLSSSGKNAVVDSHSSPYHMQFLNETDSWNLLRREVFGEDCCPSELEEAGKVIAENCKGLPLPLVVMGGHLSKANRTKDYWEGVAENVKSVVNATDENCSEILSLSYDYLPHHLKACFLYMGVFPEDAKIRVSKLIKLWVAEGFLKPVRGRTSEEVAEEYLGDLISRNLIFISEKSSRGKIKSCSIHGLLRDLCIRKAREENFFHVIDKEVNIFAEDVKYSRRLCIHIPYDNSNANPSLGSLPPVRSILCSDYGNHILGNIYESGDGKKFPLLRVLDLAEGKVDDFANGETKLVHSRYLAFSWRRFSIQPKIIPDFLWYLQTLILDCVKINLPEEIWRMRQLRHLLFRFGECYLPCPAISPIDGENLILGNLLTLSYVSISSCIKEVFERVPNLNKLGIWIEQSGRMPFSLVDLTQLETLKITCIFQRVSIQMNYPFPPNIKKLTLCGCKISRENMTGVGLMPNLEVLKLQNHGFDGQEWEPTEGEFCKLKYLLLRDTDLVQWRADDTHFRSLERLILRQCFELEEIPCSIGESPTLQSIDLDDASPSALTSAMQIQEEQNDSLQVHVLHKFQEIHRVIKELDIDEVWSNDETLQLEATTRFNKCRDSYAISRFQTKVSRVVPRFLEFLGRNDYPWLQHEASRAIIRIITMPMPTSDNINNLIDHGILPILVSLLSSPKDVLREEGLRVLRNLAHHLTKSRDRILSYGMLMPILEQFNDKTKLSIVREATETLSDLCRGEPWPHFEQMKSSILHLAELIHIDDEEVLRYACSALNNLIHGSKDIIQAVIDAGVFPRLVELLLYPSSSVSSSAMHVVGNIILKGDDIQIQIQVLIEAGIISPLLQLLQNDDIGIQAAATETIFVAITRGTNEQIKFLVYEGCVKPLCDLLVSPKVAYYYDIKICLEGLEKILKVGEAEKNQLNTGNVNVFAQMIEDAGGLQKIKNLQTHEDNEICVIVVKILETYWQEN